MFEKIKTIGVGKYDVYNQNMLCMILKTDSVPKCVSTKI